MEFTKADLRNWDVVVTRDGSRYLVNVEAELIQRNFGYRTFNQYASDLKIKNSASGDGDIMKVYRGVRVIIFTDLNECVLGDSNLIYNRKDKWKPRLGERYYIPRLTSSEYCTEPLWEDDDYDNRVLQRNLAFQTKEEAIEAAKKMLKTVERDVGMKEYNLTIADIEWGNGKKYEVMLHGGSTEEVVATGVDLKIVGGSWDGEYIADFYYLNDIARMRFREIDCG